MVKMLLYQSPIADEATTATGGSSMSASNLDVQRMTGMVTLPSLQPRIDRLALQGQHAEDALVDTAKRLLTHEAFEALDAEGELPQGPGTASWPGPACRSRERFSGNVYSGP